MTLLDRVERIEAMLGIELDRPEQPEDTDYAACEPDRNDDRLDRYRESTRKQVLDLRATAMRHAGLDAAERVQAYDNVLRFL